MWGGQAKEREGSSLGGGGCVFSVIYGGAILCSFTAPWASELKGWASAGQRQGDKKKKMFGRKLRYTGQTSPFNELLWHDEIVHTMLEWSCKLAAMAENQTSSRCDLKQYFSPFFMLISGSATKPPWAATAVTWCAAAVATTHTQRS